MTKTRLSYNLLNACLSFFLDNLMPTVASSVCECQGEFDRVTLFTALAIRSIAATIIRTFSSRMMLNVGLCDMYLVYVGVFNRLEVVITV